MITLPASEYSVNNAFSKDRHYWQHLYQFDYKVGIISNEVLFLWILSMCELQHITHKLTIKSSKLYLVCE